MASSTLSFGQVQDLRSLAVFRFLLGLYVVYDVLSRLKHGHLSMLWYTSSPGSFLHPSDSPHGSPFHKLWFYRGDDIVQAALFQFTVVLAFSFAMGLKCNVFIKVLLWLLVVAMQNRNMHVHDGSDTFVRHLLLWSCQLPMSQVWSLDALIDSKRRARNEQPIVKPHTSAIWGLRLQIVFMYLGTVLNRTTDVYGWSVNQSSWMPPQLSAVHYSLNSSFASRDCWLGDIVRTTFPLSQFMTLSAMVIEGLAPLACLLFENFAHIPAFLLFSLHLGLLVLMNLPNWQFAGMLATTIWIPASVWDSWHRTLAQRYPQTFMPPRVVDESLETKHKRNDDSASAGTVYHHQRRPRPFVTYFLLIYMIYNFCGERQWIPKHDSGDLGELLRFSQYWVMFGSPPTTSVHMILIGTVDGEQVDVWEWIRSRRMSTMNLAERRAQIWTNMTHVYPSPRWERIFDQWGQRRDTRLGRHFLVQLCKTSPFEEVSLVWQHLDTMPPNSSMRFQKSDLPDTVVNVACRTISNGG